MGINCLEKTYFKNCTRIKFDESCQKYDSPAAVVSPMRLRGVYNANQRRDFRNSKILKFTRTEFSEFRELTVL